MDDEVVSLRKRLQILWDMLHSPDRQGADFQEERDNIMDRIVECTNRIKKLTA